LPRIDEYLEEVLKSDGSDLHFMAGGPPRIRRYGQLRNLREEQLAPDVVRETLYEIMPRQAVERFEAKDGADFAYGMGDRARFRVNVLLHLDGMGAVFRAIPSRAQTLEQLGMPEAVKNLCKVNNGLILVTGKTGSGKSTTLAAMIDDLNVRLKGHILTIEDPIEFIHPRKNCLVSQREVGTHSPSFSDALHSALREDPNALHLAARRAFAAADPAPERAWPGLRARDPDQHVGRVQPDPPGQDRPAGECHAVRRDAGHAHDGCGHPAAVGRRPDQRPFRLRKGDQQDPLRTGQGRGLTAAGPTARGAMA
jgi:twitching motility protein PilT